MRSFPFASTEAMRDRLDKMAKERGISRSRLIREALYATHPELRDLKEEEREAYLAMTAAGSLIFASACLVVFFLVAALVR